MPMPFPNALQGLSEGLQSGLSMGLGFSRMAQEANLRERQMDMEKQRLAIAKQQADFQDSIKMYDLGSSLMKTGNSYQKEMGANLIKGALSNPTVMDAIKRVNSNVDFDKLNSMDLNFDGIDQHYKDIDKAYKAFKEGGEGIGGNVQLLTQSIGHTLVNVQNSNPESKKIFEDYAKNRQTEMERGYVNQATADIPELGRQGLLSPEQVKAGQRAALGMAGGEGAKAELEIYKKEEERKAKELEGPYKVGKRESFTGRDGKAYEGTYLGKGKDNEPIWGNIIKKAEEGKVPQKSDKEWAFDLNKEFKSEPVTKEFEKMRDNYAKMKAALEQGNRTGNYTGADQALIDLFNLDINPNAVVRLGIYAKTESQVSALNKIQSWVTQKFTGGSRLTNQDRQAMFDVAKAMTYEQEKSYNNMVDNYRQRAKDYGAKEDWVAKPSAIFKKTTAPPKKESVNALHPGSRLIGTYQGKKVYQSPDGKRYVEE